MIHLAGVQSRINAIRNRVQQMETNYQSGMDDWSRETRTSFSLRRNHIYDRYLQQLRREQARADQEIEQLQPLLREAQAQYNHARQQKRILERLREKRWQEYQHKLRKLEQKQSDEMNRRLHQDDSSLFESGKKPAPSRFELQEREIQREEREAEIQELIDREMSDKFGYGGYKK